MIDLVLVKKGMRCYVQDLRAVRGIGWTHLDHVLRPVRWEDKRDLSAFRYIHIKQE